MFVLQLFLCELEAISALCVFVTELFSCDIEAISALCVFVTGLFSCELEAISALCVFVQGLLLLFEDSLWTIVLEDALVSERAGSFLPKETRSCDGTSFSASSASRVVIVLLSLGHHLLPCGVHLCVCRVNRPRVQF